MVMIRYGQGMMKSMRDGVRVGGVRHTLKGVGSFECRCKDQIDHL